jgi:hypothetical protein
MCVTTPLTPDEVDELLPEDEALLPELPELPRDVLDPLAGLTVRDGVGVGLGLAVRVGVGVGVGVGVDVGLADGVGVGELEGSLTNVARVTPFVSSVAKVTVEPVPVVLLVVVPVVELLVLVPVDEPLVLDDPPPRAMVVTPLAASSVKSDWTVCEVVPVVAVAVR